MPLLAHAVVLPFVLAAAVVGHEATHYLVGRALGVRVWFESPTTVAYEIECDRATWQYRLIGAAPQLTGVVLLGVFLLTWRSVSAPTALLAAAGIALYSWGSLEDLSVRAARGETPAMVDWWESNDRIQKAAYIGSGGVYVALAVWLALAQVSPRAEFIGAMLGGGVFFGGLGAAALVATDH
jgi:hypothetical protein